MISFKKYFNLVTESPTMIRYGDSTLYMEESAITFISTPDEMYIFQTANLKLPRIFKLDEKFEIEKALSSDDKEDILHEELGSLFDLNLGASTEDEYKRGRLWIDPQNHTRMMVSIWAYQDEFKYFKGYFEAAIKKIIPYANEFTYEYAYFSQKGIDFSRGKNIKKVENTEEQKLKKQRAELLAQYHLKTGPEKLKIMNQIKDLNKKLGMKEDPFEFMKVTKPASSPSWMNRVGD